MTDVCEHCGKDLVLSETVLVHDGVMYCSAYCLGECIDEDEVLCAEEVLPEDIGIDGIEETARCADCGKKHYTRLLEAFSGEYVCMDCIDEVYYGG